MMVTEDELEDGVKGSLHTHIHYKQVSIAIGVGEDDEPVGYIYNIPQSTVDRGYLAVRASENGGSNPEVAEPYPNEFSVGFDCYDCTDEEIIEICEKTITDIGFEAIEEDDCQEETRINNSQSTDVSEEVQISMSSETETDESESTSIDLSDEF